MKKHVPFIIWSLFIGTILLLSLIYTIQAATLPCDTLKTTYPFSQQPAPARCVL